MASSPSLTKSQRRRRNETLKREAKRRFLEELGPIPAHLSAAADAFPRNIEPISTDQLTPEELAPRHMVEYGEVPTLKDEALRKIRARTAAIRRNIRDDNIASLKLKYRALWGKRGAAKIIASLETDEGNPISARMVQRYFKLSP